jgi:hypothetical protein
LRREKSGVIRAVKLRAGKSYLERPIQHLYHWSFRATVEKQTPSFLTLKHHLSVGREMLPLLLN